MIPIKFRAKALGVYETSIDGLKKGDWVFGYYYFCEKRMASIIVTTLEKECSGVGSKLVQVEVNVDPKTVSQFIGRFDKNGKEIYGGDILKVNLLYTAHREGEEYLADEDHYGVVEFMPTKGYYMKPFYAVDKSDSVADEFFRMKSCRMSSRRTFIIGNIYENPDLITDYKKKLIQKP